MAAEEEIESAAATAAMLCSPELDLAPYEQHRWQPGHVHLPVLSLDDVSGIPFLSGITGVAEYQHRARLRARTGDLFAATTAETEGFEEYCRRTLDLGAVDFVHAVAAPDPVAVARACHVGDAFAAIVARARASHGLLIHPYMGIETVWELARKIAAASHTHVGVLAPPPPVTWIANDKSAFSRLVRAVLGDHWLVETREAGSPQVLTALLLDLARRHERVALKRRRCASAMGNAVFSSADLLRDGALAALEDVESFLRRTEWDGRESVQVVAWEQTDISPSTQVWIPARGIGPPLVEGIYEQILEQERGVFVGSRPSGLTQSVHRRLEKGSLAVATGLQALGYVGRCSFDFLVVGDPAGDFALHFTECNGRWGGTSTPMALVDRLLGSSRPPYRAQDFVSSQLIGTAFTEILAAVGDDLFSPATGTGRFVFYNVGPLAEHGKFDVVSLGRTQEEAEEGLLEILPRRLGLHA